MLNFAALPGFPHEKIVVYIACTKILFPHILPFCVAEDFPLKLLDGRITYNGILLLRVLPFYK